MQLPEPCGTLSEGVVRALTAPAEGPRPVAHPNAVADVIDPLTDRDFQLALWMLYELHYRGFDDVDDRAEWAPLLIISRTTLERSFEHAVRTLVAHADTTNDTDDTDDSDGRPNDAVAQRVIAALVKMSVSEGCSEMAVFLHRRATRAEFREYLGERAVYHLRESDPQSFVLPRIGGAAKVALAELQYDEYGAGRPDRLHQELFARALRSLNLPTDLGPHVAQAAGTTLASVNLMSLFALNRRLRGAAMGHLAAFEATSSLPCERILRGIRRLDLPNEVADYYAEHVEADAVHEQLAIRSICGELVAAEPDLADDVLFGARACLAMDGMAGQALIDGWAQRSQQRLVHHDEARAAG